MRPRTRRALAAAAAAVLLGSTVSACTGDDPPDPAPVVAELAAGLAAFDLTGVPFTAATADLAVADLAAATGGLGDRRPVVEVGTITEHESDEDDGQVTAMAALSYTWDLGRPATGDEAAVNRPTWTYSTTADLALVGEGETAAWQVLWSPEAFVPTLASGERLTVRETAPQRGDILGAGGAALVTDRPVLRIGIDKTLVDATAVEESARALAQLLEIDQAVYVGRVAAAGPSAFVEALLVRADESPVTETDLAAIPGARAIADEIPLAPTREFARQLLGGVGDATAEIIEESGGAIAEGDKVGLSGLQRRYDASLRGIPGATVLALAPEGSDADPRELFFAAPVDGTPLETTLDPELQQRADDLLADVGPASAIVAIRPSTGELLVVASGPGGEGQSTATVGQYAPGSTFKIATALALIRNGSTPDSVVSCTESITVDGRRFENYDDYPPGRLGDIPLRTAFANSCNTAFISAYDDLTQADLAEAAAAIGLGVDADVGFPSFFGSVPAEDAGLTDHAASMIGQGRILVSPFAMVMAAASVGAGTTVTPVLLPTYAPSKRAIEAPVTGEEATLLRGLMESVVTDGSAAFLADVPGAPVAAKTGTAEYGAETPRQTHAWMVAVQGDLAVAVFVADGESGSRTAGPILEQILGA